MRVTWQGFRLAVLCGCVGVACEGGPVSAPEASVDVRAKVPAAAASPAPPKASARPVVPGEQRALALRPADPHSLPKALRAIVPESADRKALPKGARLHAGLAGPRGTRLFVYSSEDSGLRLAELAGTRRFVARSVGVGVDCDPRHTCKNRLIGYETSTEALTLIVIVEGNFVGGQGAFHEAQAELFALTADQLGPGVKLPVANSSDTSHGTPSEHTRLFWVAADATPPPEILALHHATSDGTQIGVDKLPGWDRRQYQLFTYAPADKTYEKLDPTPEAAPELLERLSQGAGFVWF